MGSDSSKNEKPSSRENVNVTNRFQERTGPPSHVLRSSLPVQQTPATLERARNPYNFTSSDFENNIRLSQTQRLYPDLDSVNRNFPTQQTVQSPVNVASRQQTSSPSGESTSRSDDRRSYVVLNQYQQQAHMTPSAPPAAEVMGLPDFPTARISPKPPQPRHGANDAGSSVFSNSAMINKTPKPRCESRSRAFDSKFNCPTCKKRFGLTIFNCSRGHGSCKECKEGAKVCGAEQGSCRAPITFMRNRALEDYVTEVGRNHLTECENDKCTLKFNIIDMEKHLKECPFGEMTCPMGTFFGKCFQRCKVDDMASHFDVYHLNERTADINKEMFLFNISSDTQKLYLIKVGPYTFLVHVKVCKNNGMIYMAVQLLGSAVSSAKWIYEFHIYNKRQPRRKFLYTDTCQSIGTPLSDIFSESKCVALPLAYARSFISDNLNENITYKFYIKKIDTRPTRNMRKQ